MVPGFDISVLDEAQKSEYLNYLTQLPFPYYIQEFDLVGAINPTIENVNTIDIISLLFASIPKWKQLGRWDVAWYLESIAILIEEGSVFRDNFFNPEQNSAELIIDIAYQTNDYYDNNGELTWLSHARNNTIPFPTVYQFGDATFETIYSGVDTLAAELGKSIGDCDLTNIKYYNEPKSIWEMFGFEEYDLQEVGNPEERRYWKNIIPKDYSIFNRQGVNLDANIEDGELIIDTYSEQDWLDDYYYPVLPKLGQDGNFVNDNTYPNNKIPFPINSNITNENENEENLLINITALKIDNNTIDDKSGNENLGFNISDYKPNFENGTLLPLKRRTFDRIKTSKNNGAF